MRTAPRLEAVGSGRTLSLCADDYGLSPGVCRGILELVAARRLSAVSCLVGRDAWREHASALTAEAAVLDGQVQLGLHFNLTEGRPLSPELCSSWPQFPSLQRLMASAFLRALPRAPLQLEWQAQVEAFTDAAGRLPDFIDGHQHVHHLAGVRETVLEGAAGLSARAGRRVAVRATGRLPGAGFALKRALIAGTGGRTLQRRLEQRGIAHNRCLFGVYDFQSADYRALMQAWLASLPTSGALLFCHPGHADDGIGDPIAPARERELAYLRGTGFAEDLAAAGVRLGPAW